MSPNHPPLPPFGFETAAQKFRMAEGAWKNRKFHWPLGSRLAGHARLTEFGF
jgi:nuclear transport factor 2 (NTF2) superfamily protein